MKGLNAYIGQYVDWKVYNVTKIKNKYGFRVKLIFSDGSDTTQQKGGFLTKREAEQVRTEVIGQLYSNTYVMYERVTVEEFLLFWLKEVMRPQMTDNSYVSYRNAIRKHIIPHLGNEKLTKLNRGKVQRLYNEEFKISESVVKLVKTVMNTSMAYALSKNMIASNPAEGVNLPKTNRKEEYRGREIKIQKTLNQTQLETLMEAAKGTPIYLHILFATLMGLRRSEIIALKYSDIDYINRTFQVEHQLGKKPMSKKEDFEPGTYTKQEIPVKTKSSERPSPIPDRLFEAIMEERKRYEKNRNRRKNDKRNPFFDGNYICCSSYGKPRSKDFHWPYFKALLRENGLPDIRFHDLRASYCTILLKNGFSPKAVSKLMGHATEIITIDVYGDKKELIGDCLDVLEPFILEVLPEETEQMDVSVLDCMDKVFLELTA